MTALAARPVAAARGVRPWWWTAVAVFGASRVVSTLLFVWTGSRATPESRAGARPSLLDLATAWDGTWYWLIGTSGYPAVLPLTDSGAVDTNQWAFLPVYPLFVKALTFGVLDWRVVAVAVSVLAGFGTAVVLGALLLPHLGRSAALFAVAVFSFSPLAFVLQTAYAESLGLLLLTTALLLVDRRRYLAAIVPTVLLAFTRPGVLALALAVAVQLAIRLVRARRGGPAVPPGQTGAASALVLVAVVSGLAWSGFAAMVTGRADAYFATEGAWRRLWMPDGGGITLFEPWWFAARFWTSAVVGGGAAAVLAPIVLLVVVGGFAALLVLPRVRRLGSTVVLWCAAYALWLLAVFFPQSSVFRLLMPMAPLAGALTPRSRWARGAVLVGCVALQAVWIDVVLGPVQAYWTVL